MDQQGLGGAAGGDVLHLGVHRHLQRFVEVGGGVDVHVADAVGVAGDGDLRVVHDVADEVVAAAGDDQVDGVVLLQHGAHVPARLQQGEPAAGKALDARGGAHDQVGQGAVGPGRLGAALHEDGVARLQAEGGDLHQGVGPRLEDHAEDADGHAHLEEPQPVVDLGGALGLPQGVLHGGDAAHALHGALVLARGQVEARHQRLAQLAAGRQLLRVPAVSGVGLQHRLALRLQGPGDRLEAGVAHAPRGGR